MSKIEYTPTQFQIDLEACINEAQKDTVRAKYNSFMETQLDEEYLDSLENDVQVDMESGINFK
tara:strand:- start:262 stop:450 length:189 start_codon:yes stop_codon:yes gene_type:complete